MSGFKGTKGKWVFDDVQIFSLNKEETAPVRMIANNPSPYSEYRNEWEANAMLISKAPDLLSIVADLIHELRMIDPEAKRGFAKVLELKAEQLIKDATTL